MNVKTLSNQELNSHLSKSIQKEREILSEILHLISEVDRRKLYLDLSYASLYEYLVRHHGYSAGSAYRRIEAVRLMKDIPDLAKRLESGALNLSQVSLVQKSLKQSPIQVSINEKQELLKELENKTIAQSQALVSKAFDLPVQSQTKMQYQRDESVRIEITLTKEQWEKVRQMQELLSHSFPFGNDLSKLMEYLADKVIQQKTGVKKEDQRPDKQQAEKQAKTPTPSQQQEATPKTLKPTKHHSNPISTSTRKFVLQRDQCCQFKEAQKICGSKHFLQVDHIKPRWAGGDDSPENLQALCAAHNKYRYQKQANIKAAG